MRRTAAVAATVLVAASLAACSPGGDEGGFRLPVLSPDDARAVAEAAGTSFDHREGVLRVAANGCFHWSSADDADGAWIVWPDEYTQDGDAVLIADDVRAQDGDALTGDTVLVALADLPDGVSPDSYFGAFGRFCGADEAGVLVLASFEG